MLAQLAAAAAAKRAARRRLADVTAQVGLRSPQRDEPRRAHREATEVWVALLQRAHAEGHPMADVARAAGVASSSIYYRLRATTGAR